MHKDASAWQTGNLIVDGIGIIGVIYSLSKVGDLFRAHRSTRGQSPTNEYGARMR
ncbi:MAG: hypothetical protein ACREAN_03265 [Nitrosopumilaceae archaeon]